MNQVENANEGIDRSLVVNSERGLRGLAVSESENGTEEILYNEPQEIPEESNFHIIMYIFFQIGGELVMKIAIASIIISMYNGNNASVAPLLLTLFIYHIWKVVFNLFYIVVYGDRVPEFKKAYYFDIILSIGFLILYWSFYQYFEGNVSASSLPMFVVPHICLTLVRLCVGEAIQTPYLPLSGFMFFESLQILYIALKIANPAGHSDWTMILLFYYIVFIIMLVIAYIVLALFVLFCFALLIRPDLFREMDPMAPLMICGVMFFFIWNGFISYYLLSGFHGQMEGGGLSPGKGFDISQTRLHYTAIALLICAIITLIVLVIFLIYLRETLIRILNKDKAKEISFKNFAQGLNLGVTQKSGNYFKKTTKSDVAIPEGGESPKMETCMICCDKTSDVLIHPCGHSGMCKDCVTECLKMNDKCPHCKTKMEKIYLIYYDEEKQTFLAKGQIKFK